LDYREPTSKGEEGREGRGEWKEGKREGIGYDWKKEKKGEPTSKVGGREE